MKLLETTLRDGSYAIGFRFRAGQTRLIAAELATAGFKLIEVGHGFGIGASEAGKGQAAESDSEYLAAAREGAPKTKLGMFCIPGLARLEQLERMIDEGLDFVRIGTNVTEIEASAPFVELARKRGIFTTTNLMKSYALPPAEFARKAWQSESYGSEMIYIVDSAGGMTPEEVSAYIDAVQNQCSIPFGYHGHDNLGLAVSNSLLAVDLGAEVVDSSLQGMGRSAGNAPTEQLVYLLRRCGYEIDIDARRVLRAGGKLVRWMMQPGLGEIAVLCGYCRFHSSNLDSIYEVSRETGVDVMDLIEGVSKRDLVNASVELVRAVAQELTHG